MAETSLPWDGTIGDGCPYTAGQWAAMFEALFTTDQADAQGVVENYLSELEVTGTATPVTVGTGAAMVKGRWYKNSTAITVNVPTPVGATRIDRIVLQASWTAQTVRMTRLQGTEGVATPPGLTQIDGDTWEIPLAALTITTGGVISVADEREFCVWGASGTPGPLTVDTGQIVDDAVTAAKIPDRTRTVFVSVTATAGDNNWPYVTLTDGADESVYISFALPADYDSGLQVQAVVIPKGTGNIYCQYHSNSADDGDLASSNAQSSGFLTIAVVQDTIEVLTAHAFASDDEDYFGVRFQRDASNIADTVNANVRLVGLLVTYTADS